MRETHNVDGSPQATTRRPRSRIWPRKLLGGTERERVTPGCAARVPPSWRHLAAPPIAPSRKACCSRSDCGYPDQGRAPRRSRRRLGGHRGEMQEAAFVRGPGHSNSDDWTAARRRRFQVSNAARPAHAVLQIGVAAAGELGSGHRGSEAQDCGAALLGGRAPDAPSASHSRVGPAAPCHCDPSLKSESSRCQPLVMPPLAH